MPIFEYRCSQCGTVSEYLIIRRGDDEGLVCKACGDESLTKIMSVTGGYTMGASANPAKARCCGAADRGAPPPCGAGGRCCH